MHVVKYRKFGVLDWESSILGMGVSRLSGAQSDERGAVGAPQTARLIRHGIDQGVNYVDLGFPWDLGRHEAVIRTVRGALENGYREKIRLALTVPAALITSPEDLETCLDRQLGWLGADEVDFCLLGRLTRDNWPLLQSAGILESLEKVQEDGRVGAVGFSFYDQYQVLKSIVGAYDRWTLCSLQYSYMDVKHNPGTNGIRWAAEQGLAVVVTHPLKGGRLTKEPPEEVRQVWARSPRQWSLAEWGLRFVWNEPGVAVAVCDMNSMEQLDENLTIADTVEPDGLSIAEQVTISNAADALRKRQRVPCPSCRPCMPCPEGIDVPRFFEIYNDALIYDDVDTARVLCEQEQIHPGDCTECGICERRCTKRLHMIDRLKEGSDYLGVR